MTNLVSDPFPDAQYNSAMTDDLLHLLLLALPLFLSAGAGLVFSNSLPASSRRLGAMTTLSAMLLSFGISLLLIRMNTHSDTINARRWIAASLAMLGAGFASAPLLDRARTGGLVVTASIAGMFTVPLVLHLLMAKLPLIGGVALLYTVLIAAVVIGLGGSYSLPRHPARVTATGIRRAQILPAPMLLLGWVLLGLTFLLYGALMRATDQPLTLWPTLASILVATSFTLMRTAKHDALRKVGEAFAAAILISLMTPWPPEVSAGLGLIAGFLVLRSEAITDALRLDDPQNLTGTVLLPSMIGLTMVMSADQLAAHLLWLGAAWSIGIIGAVILWPLARLTLGLALPPSLLK